MDPTVLQAYDYMIHFCDNLTFINITAPIVVHQFLRYLYSHLNDFSNLNVF